MKILLKISVYIILVYTFIQGWIQESDIFIASLGLLGIDSNSSEECESCDSGLVRLAVIECDGVDLSASTFDPVTGCITGLVFTGAGLAGLYVPDSDNTAFLNFIGDRPNNGSVHNVNIDGFTKFKCLTKNKIAEANRLKKGCCFILVAEYNDCNVMVGGIDILENCSVDGELRTAKQQIRGTVSIIPGNGSDESRMEVIWQGVQRCFTALDQDQQTFDDVLEAAGIAA